MAKARVLVLTGAGVSADSGVATFRGAGGLWEGHRIEDVATPQAWRRDPTLVWKFYQLRRAQLRTVEPNAAHAALAEFERACAGRSIEFTLVTQNVDDLHDRAGSTVLHMHGELAKLRCEACGERVHDLERTDPASPIPCAACGAPRLRPDIVWFGEIPYYMDEIAGRLDAATHFLSIGTSGVVYPAAGFLSEVRARGAVTIVNSLDAPENMHPRDRFVPGRAAEVVPPMLRALLEELPRG